MILMISGGDGLLPVQGNSGESWAIRVRLDSEPRGRDGGNVRSGNVKQSL
jgi:hypothetical protein